MTSPLNKTSAQALARIREQGLDGLPVDEVPYQTLMGLRKRGLIHGWTETADGRYVVRISEAGRTYPLTKR